MRILILLILLFSFSCNKENSSGSTDLKNTKIDFEIKKYSGVAIVDSIEGRKIYSKPDENSKIIAVAKKNEVLKIKKKYSNLMEGSWFKVKYKKFSGFITYSSVDILTQKDYDDYLESKNKPVGYIVTKIPYPLYAAVSVPQLTEVRIIKVGKRFTEVMLKWYRGKIKNEFLVRNKDDLNKYNPGNKELVERIKNHKNRRLKLSNYDLFIEEIGDKFIVYTFRYGQMKTIMLSEEIWYKGKNGFFKIELPLHYFHNFKAVFLNNDEYVDIIASGGCCDSHEVVILLGQKQHMFKKIYEKSGVYIPSDAEVNEKSSAPEIISYGKCEAFKIKLLDKKYYFDCKTDSMKLLN